MLHAVRVSCLEGGQPCGLAPLSCYTKSMQYRDAFERYVQRAYGDGKVDPHLRYHLSLAFYYGAHAAVQRLGDLATRHDASQTPDGKLASIATHDAALRLSVDETQDYYEE